MKHANGALALMVLLCGGCGGRGETSRDGGVVVLELDGGVEGAVDAGEHPDAARAADAGPAPDAGGSGAAEDCATAEDEDGNGYGGCDDPACWREDRCIQEEFAERVDPTGATDIATRCGATVTLDAEMMARRCEEGMTLGRDWIEEDSSGEREVRCREKQMTAILEMFCQPGTDIRALRWTLEIDVSGRSDMVGPAMYENVRYRLETDGFYVATSFGSRAHGGGSIVGPQREADVLVGHPEEVSSTSTHHRHIVDWVIAERGTRFAVYPFIFETTLALTIVDGEPVPSAETYAFYYAGVLDVTLWDSPTP